MASDSDVVHKRRHHKKARTGCITCKYEGFLLVLSSSPPASVRACARQTTPEQPQMQTAMLTARQDPPRQVRRGEALLPAMHLDRPQLRRLRASRRLRAARRRQLQQQQQLQLPQSPPRPVPANLGTRRESRSLEFFHCRTVTMLCGLQDSGAWTPLLLRVSASEPAIKHAMMALSAFHERCELLGVPLLEDESGLDHPSSGDAFALQHYTRAIFLLRQRLTHGEQSHTVTLLSCVLFVCLEFLRGNKASAITHLRSGLGIIRSRLPSRAPSNRLQQNLTPAGIVDGNLVPLFSRLSLLQSLYGQPRTSCYGPSGSGPFLDLLDVDTGPPRLFFDDVNAARTAGVNVCNSTLRFAFLIDYGHFADDAAMYAAQRALLGQSRAWEDALELLMATLSAAELPHAQLLAAHNYISRVWMLSAPERTQRAWDSHIGLFERIHACCLPMIEQLERAGRAPSFTLDAGLLSTLFFASTKCRHRFFRRQLIALLGRAPHREGLWKAAEVTRVAEKVAAVEEEPIRADLDALYPPEHSRVWDLDIQPRTAYDPGRQFVRLKMKPDGLDADFVWRTEFIRW